MAHKTFDVWIKAVSKPKFPAVLNWFRRRTFQVLNSTPSLFWSSRIQRVRMSFVFFFNSSTYWVMWTFSVRSKERDGMKRRQNLTNVVHFLSWMKHITKASETEFSSEMVIADNHLQSCLHPAWFWKIVINDWKFEGGSVVVVLLKILRLVCASQMKQGLTCLRRCHNQDYKLRHPEFKSKRTRPKC